ncbi:MAG: oligosaccharide flippase family protein [Chitinophagales bacterium]
MFSEKSIRILILIAIVPLVARYLGPDDYGTFNVARAFSSIFILAAPLGIPNILLRELVKKPNDKFELIGTTIIIRLISAVALYILMVVFAILFKYSTLEVALISILGISMIGQVFDTVDNYLQSIIKLKSSSKIRLIALIIGSLAKLVLIYVKAPMIAFAWVFSIEFILIAFGFIIIYKKYGHGFKELSFNIKILKPLLITSLPLLYYTILSTINMKIDQLMIDRILVDDPAANGYYAVVVGLIESLYFIPVC